MRNQNCCCRKFCLPCCCHCYRLSDCSELLPDYSESPSPDCPDCPESPECKRKCCCPRGELVRNGGMEIFRDVPGGELPAYWYSDNPGAVERITASGEVHSGESAAGLRDGGSLRQRVRVEPGCFYEFSFFAHSEGANTALEAEVVFVTESGARVSGGLVTVRERDIPTANRVFSYYRVVTAAAPPDVRYAVIGFYVSAQGNQTLSIDDVSFNGL